MDELKIMTGFIDKVDKKVDKLENKVNELSDKFQENQLQVTKTYNILEQNIIKLTDAIGPLTETLNKFKDNTDKRLDLLENAEANKALAEKNAIKNKILMWVIGVLLAGIGMFVGIIWGVVTANTQNIIDHNINNPNIQSEVVDNGN